MEPPVIAELRASVFHITLNRPEVHNALDEDLVERLRQAVERAEGERDAAVVLLAGNGPSFCAGADLRWMQELGAASGEENRRSAERLARLFLSLERMEKPLVGRLHGSILGGGVGLASVCDVAIAAANARFSLSEVRLGLIPAVIAPYLLRRLGPARARELVLTARRFDGEEARELGLVDRAVEASLLDEAVASAIAELRAGGPRALATSKKLFRELEASPLAGEELADWTAHLLANVRAGAEARAGLQAFLEKTPPPWAPRGG